MPYIEKLKSNSTHFMPRNVFQEASMSGRWIWKMCVIKKSVPYTRYLFVLCLLVEIQFIEIVYRTQYRIWQTRGNYILLKLFQVQLHIAKTSKLFNIWNIGQTKIIYNRLFLYTLFLCSTEKSWLLRAKYTKTNLL